MSGDGLSARSAARSPRPATPMGILPGGRGNDLARVLGIPTEPAGAVAVARRGPRARDRRRRGERPPLPLHRLLWIRLRRQPDRQRGAARQGQPGLRLRRPPYPGRLEARTPSRVVLDGGEPIEFDGLLGRSGQQPGLRRGDVHRSARRARRRPPRRDHGQRRQQAPLPQGTAARSFKGTHIENEEVTRDARRRRSRSAPTATSRSTPTASTSLTCRRLRSPACPTRSRHPALIAAPR